ncbi:MAG: hypothetical protein IIC51_11325 [Planctomycetes bacterium]|nr:hypothetical protein [Planctomycetota bacterium]
MPRNITRSLKAARQDANADNELYRYANSAYYRQRAIDRFTDFLPYFDEQDALLEDRADSTSRSLSPERKILQKLLGNLQDPYG